MRACVVCVCVCACARLRFQSTTNRPNATRIRALSWDFLCLESITSKISMPLSNHVAENQKNLTAKKINQYASYF